MPLYDFTCGNGHLFEARVGYDVVSVPCRECELAADKELVYLITPITETGVKVSRRNPVPRDEKRIKLSKFQEAAAEMEYTHKKAEERAQRPLDNPQYFREGVRRAKAVLAGKAPPPKEF